MVSPEQQKAAGRKLAQWLDNDKRMVTFREVSREVGCHVNTAKNILLRHYKANPDLCPTYLLSGPLKSSAHLAQTSLEPTAPSTPTATQSLAHLATQGVRIVDMDEMSDADRNSEPDVEDEFGMRNGTGGGGWPGNDVGDADGMEGGRGIGVVRKDEEIVPEEVPKWGCVLVQADRLEEKKELFEADDLSIHIYALSPAPVKDPAQYLISSLNVRSHKAYFKPEVYGTISGDPFKSSAAALKDGGMNWGNKQEEKKAEQKVVEEKKGSKHPEVKQKDDKPKSEPEKVEQDKPTSKPSTQEKATKSAKAKAEKPAKATAPSKKRSQTVGEEPEPETGTSPAPVAGSSRVPLQPTSSMTRADDAAAMEAMMGMDYDMESDQEEEPATRKKGKQGQVVKDEVISVKTEPGQRKRRKVRKQEMVEENGYMVTRDVWEEESYSGDSDPEPPAKATKTTSRKFTTDETTKKADPPKQQERSKPPPKNVPGGAKKGGQSTLAGFFTKK